MSFPAVSRHRQPLHAYALVAPYALFLLLFGLGPALYAVALSVTDPNKSGFSFTGLTNYQDVWRDFRLAPAFEHVGAFMLIWLPLLVILTLFLALMLHGRPDHYSATMRLIYYLPGAVTGSASALVWLFMLSPDVSPFGPVLRMLGLPTRDAVFTNYLAEAFAAMAVTTGVGGWVVIVYGALNGISTEVLEAAMVDGCNAIQTALFIKLPSITKYITFILILSFAGGTQLFVEPQILSSITQQEVSQTWSVNQLAYYYAFNDDNFSKSAALSVALLVIGLLAALFVIYKTDFYRIDVEGR